MENLTPVQEDLDEERKYNTETYTSSSKQQSVIESYISDIDHHMTSIHSYTSYQIVHSKINLYEIK